MAPRDASTGPALPEVIPPPPGSRWRWVPLLVIGLVVLELASRVEDRIVYGMPLLSRVQSSNQLVLRDSLGARGRPNATFRRWHLDSLGFRGPNVPIAAPTGTIRIVTTGASETFGLYESVDKEYPRQLEDSLRARVAQACGAEAPDLEVVNAALPGMALPSLDGHLRARVAVMHPSIVVIYPSPAFYLNDRAPAPARPSDNDTTLAVTRALVPRFPDRLVTQVKALAPEWVMTLVRERAIASTASKFVPGWRFTAVPEDRVQQFDGDLRRVIGTVRAMGATPVLMGYVNRTMSPGFDDEALLVSWEYQFPRAEREVIPAFHARAAKSITDVARDSSVAYVDLARAFDGRWQGAFADFVHFTDAGAATVASALSEALAPHGHGSACTLSPTQR